MAIGEQLNREDVRRIVEKFIKDNLSIEIKHEVKSEYFGCNVGCKDINIIEVKILLDGDVIASDDFSVEC